MLQTFRSNVAFLPTLPLRCAHVCANGSRSGQQCCRLSRPVPVEQARAPDGDCGPEAKFMEFKR